MSPVVSRPADSVSLTSIKRTSGPVRRAKGCWTPEEDETLRNAVNAFKGRYWKKIAEFVPGRTEVQCLHRWQKVLNPELVKGSWTQEEDDIIINMVKKHGPRKWSVIASSLNGRIGKQCRERWHNHLDPQIRKEAWTAEECVIANAHHVYGNKWAEIAKLLHGSLSVWTADRLARHGMDHPDKCPLCDQEEETIDHLLVSCAFAKQFWFIFLSQVNLQVLSPQPEDSSFLHWWEKASRVVTGPARKGLDSLFILGAWVLWKHRNRCVFDAAPSNLAAALSQAWEE